MFKKFQMKYSKFKAIGLIANLEKSIITGKVIFIGHFLRLTMEPFVLNLEVLHLKRYQDDGKKDKLSILFDKVTNNSLKIDLFHVS